MLWTVVVAWSGADAAPTARPEVSQALATCGPWATTPPPGLDARDLQRLEEGEVVQLLQRGEDDHPTAAVGLVLAEASVPEAWLACQGPHAAPGENPEFLVEELPDEQDVWYGYVALPWPLRDRQYVVRSGPNHRMARATGNRCWEHAWREYPSGLDAVRPMVAREPIEGVTPEAVDDAVLTSWNRGSWLVAGVDDAHTLIVFQASLVVDGSVPDWIVPRLTAARLGGMLTRVRERAETWAAPHYDASHAPFVGGDGRVMAPLR